MIIPQHSFAVTLSSISIPICKDALLPDWLASIDASIRTLNLWFNYTCPGHSYPCDLRTGPGIRYACSPKILCVLLLADPPSVHMVCSSTSCSFHLNFPFSVKTTAPYNHVPNGPAMLNFPFQDSNCFPMCHRVTLPYFHKSFSFLSTETQVLYLLYIHEIHFQIVWLQMVDKQCHKSKYWMNDKIKHPIFKKNKKRWCEVNSSRHCCA